MNTKLKMAHLGAFLALVAASAFLALEAIHGNFVMMDEYAHIPAGMSYWQVGRFSLYRENPPLVQCLVALPPLVAGAKVDYTHAGGGRSEWTVGRDFLIANAARLHDLVRWSRCVVLALGIASGALIFWWVGELYGGWAAVVCSALWLLDPSVLAFSGIGTADVGSATFGTIATYAFWRFLNRPDRTRTILAGIGLGLALASKFTMMVLYPAWLLLILLSRVCPPEGLTVPTLGRLATKFLAIGAIGLFLLNALYVFDGTCTPLGAFSFRSRAFSGEATSSVSTPPKGNRFRGTILDELPVPLPRQYLLGLDSQKWEAEVGLEDLRGGRLTRGGQWYSPLRTLALKLPPGTLLLLVTSAFFWAGVRPRYRLAGLTLWVPAAFLIASLCLQTGLNWPIRYALSALPFMVIAAGQFVGFALDHRRWRWLVIACLLWNVVEVVRVRPHFLSYANALAGGAEGAQVVFHGSNYDWGQDLYRFRSWYDKHPGLRPLSFSYYGAIGPDYLGIPAWTLPASLLQEGATGALKPWVQGANRPFYWAISSNILNGMTGYFVLDNGFTYRGRIRSPHLRREDAIARIGYSIYVFRIDPAGMQPPSSGGIELRNLSGCLKVDGIGDGIDASP